MKTFKLILILLALASVVGWVGYMYIQSLLETNVVINNVKPEPEVVVQVEYKEKYDEIVLQILADEKTMWEERARLSAERQASEQLAKQFEEMANQKRLEEQSL